MKRSCLVLLLLIILVTGPAAAQEPNFKLTATDTKISQGTTTYLKLTATNAQGAELVKLNGVDNFKSAYRGSAQQIQIVNGERTVTKEYNYNLTPTEPGKFKIQGVVEYQGERYQTNQLVIQVTEGTTAEQPQKKLFIKTKLSQDRLYLGQKAILEYELFSRYRVENSGFLENIEADSFMTEKLDKGKQKLVQIEGKKYLKQKVGRVILTPLKTGRFKIPSFRFQVNLSSGDGVFSSTTAKRLTTEAQQIKVKPLPQQGQPDDFSGLVGNLELTGRFSAKEVEVGESVTLAVTAAGSCNLDNLDKLVKQDLPQVEIYETEQKSREQIKKGKYYRQDKYQVIFVPRQGGQVKIPDLKLSYFNPQTKEYETAAIGGQMLTVSGQSDQQASSASGKTVTVSQITVPEQKDERYYTLQLRKDYVRWVGIGCLVVMLISGVGAVAYRYWRRSQDQLTTIYRQLQQETKEEEIYELFNQLIKEKYGFSLKATSRRQLKQRIDNQQLAAKIQKVVDYFEAKDKNLDLEAEIDSIYSELKEI